MIRKAPMKGIDVNTYEVDAEKVAEAILRRLLAGSRSR
jgi:anti-sigma28 factor (negative regulator of flagellin synthesis)